MTDYTLHLGDCLEIMQGMDAASVDAVITDPPYFLPAQHYQTRKEFRRNFSDLGILEHFFKDYFDTIARVLKPTGVFYMFCDGQSYPVLWYHGFAVAKRVRPLIWDKQVSINGYHWRHQHELVLFGEMPECKPFPTGDGDILRCRAVPVEQRQHPAEKPVPLLRNLVAKCGDTILDPFMGRGSTGVAALMEGRKFIGIELDANYYKIAQRDIEQVQPSLLAEAAD